MELCGGVSDEQTHISQGADQAELGPYVVNVLGLLGLESVASGTERCCAIENAFRTSFGSSRPRYPGS